MARKPTGNPNGRPCVYRYIDDETGVVKYVGIVHKSSLQKRLTAHRFCDSWALDACWRIEYFECENRSEAEAFESHLISLYGTDKYYNKAKKHGALIAFCRMLNHGGRLLKFHGMIAF